MTGDQNNEELCWECTGAGMNTSGGPCKVCHATGVLKKKIMKGIKKCCDEFERQINKNKIFQAASNLPLIKMAMPATVFIMPDGSQGGIEPIFFCPFCGTKIERLPITDSNSMLDSMTDKEISNLIEPIK